MIPSVACEWRLPAATERGRVCPAWSTTISRFLYRLYAFPCARASKLNQQIHILPEPGCKSKLTQILKLTPVHYWLVVSCLLAQRCVVCNGMYFTTGSWQCCLSLDIVSSIPTRSTINFFIPLWFIHISLCQRINIKPTHICCRADCRSAPSQWETSLQSNAVSLWLGANLESALICAGRKFPSMSSIVSTHSPLLGWWLWHYLAVFIPAQQRDTCPQSPGILTWSRLSAIPLRYQVRSK